jgi:hypothetical protein
MEEINLDSETDYVIHGTKAAVKPDKTHELILEKKLWDIKEVVLAQVHAAGHTHESDYFFLMTFFPLTVIIMSAWLNNFINTPFCD